MEKVTRNVVFYKNEDDCTLNSKIESNFNQMLKALLANPDFGNIVGAPNQSPQKLDLEDFVIRDGIYPGYTQQKFKVLFVGRDCHGLKGYDYSWTTWDNLKKQRQGGYKNFDRSIMAIGYVLSKGFGIDSITKVVSNIYKDITHNHKYEDLSFAFVNLSKIDNHKDCYKFRKKDAEFFVRVVGKQLINEQIDIISPDLIIGLNLEDCNMNVFKEIFNCEPCNNSYKTFRLYKFETEKGDVIDFIDSKKHFSCFSKDAICSFLSEVISLKYTNPHSLGLLKQPELKELNR